jgi:DNA-binding beta-propeller fold protein YncE
MNRRLHRAAYGSAALTAGVVLIAGLMPGAVAQEQQPLKRVVTIQLKGASGLLDHVLVDAKHERLFLANQSNNTLDIVDLATNKLVKQVPDQKEIHGIAYVPDLDRIFVGNGVGVCNVLDGRDYTLLKSIPVKDADNVHYDPQTKHVFVAGEKDLAVIDAGSLELVTTINLPASPEGFQIATGRRLLYLNVGSPFQVIVIDTDKNEIAGRYPLMAAKGIETLALDEADKRIFVGFRGEPRIVALDQDSGNELTSIAIPEGIDDMFFDAKAKRIYASCGSGFVAVVRQIDADHYERVANVATIKGAKTCYYDGATARLYLAVPRQEGEEGPEVWVYQGNP